MSNTAHKIIDLAEAAIATEGYSAFSFRIIAAELGVKSASVHYHFPTKAHPGLAVAHRYRQQMLTSHRMSVCMMLAAEINILPVEIQVEMHSFYHLNLNWLRKNTQRLGRSTYCKKPVRSLRSCKAR